MGTKPSRQSWSRSNESIAALPTPARKSVRYRHESIPRLYCVVSASGGRSFALKYGDKYLTIGSSQNWSVRQAEERGRELNRQIDAGADPAGELRAAKKADTIDDLADDFEENHLPTLARSTRLTYQYFLGKWVRPEFGRQKVYEPTREAIERWHLAVTQTREYNKKRRRWIGGPHTATHSLQVLSLLMKRAVSQGLRPDDPTKGIKYNPQVERHRYYTQDELDRFLAALAEYPEASPRHNATDIFNRQTQADVWRLCLFTGKRLNEVQSATVGEFDLSRQVVIWTKQARDVKQDRVHRVPLNPPAAALVRQRIEIAQERGTEYLFPGAMGNKATDFRTGRTGCHLTRNSAAWAEICRMAGLANARIHDLRHTFASLCINANVDLYTVSKLLGHKRIQMTQRYAHLYTSTLLDGTKRVGAVFSGHAVVQLPKAEPVPVPAPPPITVRAAARMVGKTANSIWRVIKDGKLSSTLAENGEKLVDPAEVMRLFPRKAGAASSLPSSPRLQASLPLL